MTEIDLDLLAQIPEEARLALFAQLTLVERQAIEDALLARLAGIDPLAGMPWPEWNATVAPHFVDADYAPCHEQFWAWLDTITPDVSPRPFMAIWPRGLAKSTTAELAVAKLGCRGLRSYALVVSHTQDQADDHVGNIAAILESEAIAKHYPAMGAVKLNKYGSSQGWRRNRIRTASGFTVDAIGLDVSRRGAKLEHQRPDILVLDDVDDTHASISVVQKNIETISQVFIPALTPNAVIMMAQNIVAAAGIAARIADGRTKMMIGAIKSGPFPAVDGLEFEMYFDTDPATGERVEACRITAGTPVWPGRFGIAECERQIAAMGPDAYMIECQQDVSERPGAIWRKDEIDHVSPDAVPELEVVVVGIDPNKTGRGDDAGVVVVGRARIDGVLHAYVLADYSAMTVPSKWRDEAARAAIRHNAPTMVVEFAGLGEHAELTVKGSPLLEDFPVSVKEAKAKLGKKDRARPVWRKYIDKQVHHVGHMPYLEGQLTGWVPDQDPMSPGGLDALVHAVTHLLIDVSGAPNVGVG